LKDERSTQKEVIKMRLCGLLVVVASLLPGAAQGDRGMIPLDKMHPDVTIYGPGQKAIIACNGTEELLILSTDLYAEKKTQVLEFLPLPSKPTDVREGSFESFEFVSRLIQMRAPKIERGRALKTAGGGPGAPAVEVVFHKKIGPHDITIARSSDTKEFVDWILKFAKKADAPLSDQVKRRLLPIVEGYLRDSLNYFVFDLVDLDTEPESLKPIVYRFPCKRLYFPLRVSALAAGATEIDLFLLTPIKPDIWGTNSRLACRFYHAGPNAPQESLVPIKFPLYAGEFEPIDKAISKIFQTRCWFSTAKYSGPTSALKRDFWIDVSGRASFPDTWRP
jgi:hypothetical protein